MNGFRAASVGASGVAPTEAAGRGGLILAREQGGVRRSLWLQHSGQDELALRGYHEGDPTGGWHRLYGEMNLLGTVAESGGEPKGAVFEAGSGPNGSYHRHADGRLECRHVLTASASGMVSWSYPSAFIAAPVVSLTPVSTALASAQLDASPGAGGLSFSVRDAAGARMAVPCHLLAIGRWF